MANGDPIQGLRVAFKFADSQDTREILRNLDLNIEDLNRIRRIASDGGVQKTDIRTLSGLSIDLEKEALAVYNETQSYQNVLTNLNDGNRNIPGNINVNSSLISPSFKFNKLNYDTTPVSYETIDFSTSRSSAWSSFGSAEASIFYGGDVIISGATSNLELSSLQFMETPKQKRFESEVATHKIRINIDNEPYDMYAMKSIPIQFKAFFRSATNMRVDFNVLDNLRPTWVIKNPPVNGVQPEFVFQNRSTTTGIERQSIISFFDSRSTERTIEFYYPTDRIRRIYLNATRLLQIPNAIIPNLIDFRATDGDLVEMPNVASLYPSIEYLDLSRNDLTRSNTQRLKTFSPDIVQRLKTPNNTLRTLVLDNVYANQTTIPVTSAASNGADPSIITVTTTSAHGLLVGTNININFTTGTNATSASGVFTVASIPTTTTFTYTARTGAVVTTPGGVITLYAIADLGQLVGLTTFQAVSAGNLRRMTGTSPAVGAGMINYTIQANFFNTLHPSVLQSTSLQVLNIRSNGISSALDASGTNLQAIKYFTTGGNSHPIVDLSAKPDLIQYISDNQNFTVNAIGTTVFRDCPLLSRIDVYSSNITGRLPDFSTNTSLSIFYSWSSAWLDASVDYSIEADTFGQTSGGCRRTLSQFYLQSSNLRGPIHPDAFRNMPGLNTLVVRSNRRGITGVYPPSIDQCFNLRSLYLDGNFIGGDVPNFAGNTRINTIVLSQNSFTGTVPLINLPQLSILFINNNSLTGFLGLTCPNLTQLNASVNLLTQMPRLLNTPRLQILLLNNNPGMTYTSGELSLVTTIRRVEMANCGFDRGTVDQILIDLNANYNLSPRRGVFVNLVGNASPSAVTEITTIINRLRREGWTLGLQA